MANAKSTNRNYEYAVVDTAPGAAGYWTNIVNPRKSGISRLFFSIRNTDIEDSSGAADAVIIVTLQFKCSGDLDWQDFYYSSDGFVIGDRVEIGDIGPGTQWRAGVKDQDFTSGSVKFGFDWYK